MFRAILLSSIVVNAGILLGRLAGFARGNCKEFWSLI